MRLTTIFAASLLAVVLAGCDQTPQATAPAAPLPPQASVLPTAPPVAPPAVQAAHHRHHHYRYASQSYSREDYSESEVTDYDYRSDSHLSSETGDAAHGRQSYGLWVDGYGRGYDSDAHARVSGTMTRERLKPWAHYDQDCDK